MASRSGIGSTSQRLVNVAWMTTASGIPDKPPEAYHLETTLDCHLLVSGLLNVHSRRAHTLAQSLIGDQLHGRLQPFRHLHDCSGCFQLEPTPGGAGARWKAPPSYGAHVKRTCRSRHCKPSWVVMRRASARNGALRATRKNAGEKQRVDRYGC